MDIIKKYQSDNYRFPSRNIDPKQKLLPEYGIRMCESIYSTYVNDKCGFPFTFIEDYDRIRKYGNGKQDPAIYMEHLMGKQEVKPNEIVTSFDGSWNNMTVKKKGYGNILWDIVGLAVRVKQAILGSFEEVDYDVLADTIDPHSTAEQEQKKSEIFAESQNLNFINAIKKNAGLPPENPSTYPSDLDELQLMEDMGEFKTGVAKAIEKVCRHTFEISNWYEIKRRLIEDIIDFNACGTRDYYDDTECKWKTKYIDITRVLAQYSDERDFNDSCYFGYIDIVSISSIRHKLEALGYDEMQIKTLGQSWGGYFGNPVQDDWRKYNIQDAYGEWLYDFYKVAVLDVEWIDSDSEYKQLKNKNGTVISYNQPYGEIINKENRKTKITTLRRKYEAKWVIGSEIIFDHRLSYAQYHKKNKSPQMSYHLYKGNEESITKRLKPFYDNFQMAWLRLQKDLADDFDGVTLMDMSLFSRISIKGKDYDILSLVDLMKKTRILPFRSLPMNGKYPGGDTMPIKKIPSTLMESVNKSILIFQNALNLIEYVTGINPVALGSQPTQEGKATTEMALQGTTRVLKPIISSIFKVKQESAMNVAEGARLTIQSNKDCYNAYSRVIGLNDTNDLKKSDYDLTELGISLIPRPTSSDVQNIIQAAQSALEDGRNDKPGITMDVYIYIIEKLNNGANLKDIRLYLANAIKKNTAYIQSMKEKNMQMQGQINGQNQQQLAQAKQQEIDTETKAQIAIDNNKHENTMMENYYKYSHEKYIKEQEMQMQQMNNQNTQQNAGNNQGQPVIAGQ